MHLRTSSNFVDPVTSASARAEAGTGIVTAHVHASKRFYYVPRDRSTTRRERHNVTFCESRLDRYIVVVFVVVVAMSFGVDENSAIVRHGFAVFWRSNKCAFVLNGIFAKAAVCDTVEYYDAVCNINIIMQRARN